MKVKELIELLSKCDQEEEIFIWRGNGNMFFDYTSNIEVARPYGCVSTNIGPVDYPLILGSSYDDDKECEKEYRF